jgi:hypothetical protein
MAALLLSACITLPTVAVSAPGPFTDPFAYCAAVGTIAAPDARYAGPKTPESIIKPLRQAAGISADAPMQMLESGTFWRCANGKVMACFVGANLPCQEKAQASRTPTPAMGNFCRSHPHADSIPAAVTGKATLYTWRCRNGRAQVDKKIFKADAQGFIADFWYEMKPSK